MFSSAAVGVAATDGDTTTTATTTARARAHQTIVLMLMMLVLITNIVNVLVVALMLAAIMRLVFTTADVGAVSIAMVGLVGFKQSCEHLSSSFKLVVLLVRLLWALCATCTPLSFSQPFKDPCPTTMKRTSTCTRT